MKQGKIITISILLAVTAVAAQSAENRKIETVNKKEKITFDSYLEKIRGKLPEMQKNRLAVEKAKNSLYASRAQEDFSLSSSFKYYYENPASTSPATSLDSTSGFASSVGVNKKFIETGTQISTGVEYGSSNIKSTALSLDSTSHTPAVYLSITQPLLNNAFGLVDRFAKNNARMQLAIEKLKKRENDKATLSYYRKLYFSWIDYRKRLNILQKNIQGARNLYNQTTRKYRAGLADNDDVQRSLSSLLQYQQQHKEAGTALESIERELNLYFDISGYEPDTQEFNQYFNTALKEVYPAVSYIKTRSCEIYRLTHENLKYNEKVTKNQLLPQLNLEASVKVKSQQDEFNSSMAEMNDVDYSIGFSVSYPLGNTEAQSKIKDAEIAIREINREYEITENSYRKNLENIQLSVSGKKSIHDLKLKNLNALKSKYRTEQQKYRQARINLSYLVDTGISISNEEINLLQLKRDLINYYIDYRDLTE